MKNGLRLLTVLFCLQTITVAAQTTDTLILRDIVWDRTAPAGSVELFIPSGDALLAGFIYRANGPGKHPTLLLLHGYPGNERNLDLAQVARARGWNAIYFDYRGSWASQGKFSFTNCIEDVKNVVAFCKQYSDSLGIDTSGIVLFGHSMGGWICLKALQQLPTVKKGFVLSAWDIPASFRDAKTEKEMLDIARDRNRPGGYFVLNASTDEIFQPVIRNRSFYDLRNDGKALAGKQIIMLDENNRNRQIADAIGKENRSFFQFEVWNTDHSFTNKRVALIKKVLAFIASR